MNIAIIDNDLELSKYNSYPNLALMKISAYYKKMGHNVKLESILSFDPSTLFKPNFDMIFLGKVFSNTKTPDYIMNNENIIKGGSGFYYENAEKLQNDIEHTMPDYNLYSSNIIKKYSIKTRQDYFTKFSIGFTTRGCIRRCSFCINKNEKTVYKHSELSEFVDNNKPFITLLDDNIVAYDGFEDIFKQLNNTGKQFVFKQGLDFRLLNERKMNILFNSNYLRNDKNYKNKGSITFHFAFDNIKDYQLIEHNLKLMLRVKKYAFKTMFYVFAGFDRLEKYDNNFYKNDIVDLLIRIKLLFEHASFPYIMLHENYIKSPYNLVLKELKTICNFPAYYGGGKTLKDALIQKGSICTVNYLKENNLSEFLNIKFIWK